MKITDKELDKHLCEHSRRTISKEDREYLKQAIAEDMETQKYVEISEEYYRYPRLWVPGGCSDVSSAVYELYRLWFMIL